MWEKEKLLVTSNFSFSRNVFKSCLLLMHQNEYLWSNGLNAPVVESLTKQGKIGNHSNADNKANGNKMTISVFDRVVNSEGKGEHAGYQHFLLFLTMFSTLSETNFNFSVTYIMMSANRSRI